MPSVTLIMAAWHRAYTMLLSFMEGSLRGSPLLSSGFDPLSTTKLFEDKDGRYLTKILMIGLVGSLIRACSMFPVMCGQICLHLQVD